MATCCCVIVDGDMCYCHYTIVSLQEDELSQVEVGA